MKPHKLITLISLFSPLDLRNLKDFVHSPIYNKNENISQLIEYLIDNFQFPEKVSDEILFSLIYPNTIFDKTQLSRLRYNAFALIEQFIIFKAQKSQPVHSGMALLAFYSTHQQSAFFEKAAEKIQSYFSQNTLNDSPRQYELFWVNETLARFKIQSQQRGVAVHLPEIEEHLNVFFISQKLELACTALSRKKVLQSEFQPEMLGEILNYIEMRPQLLNYPSVAVYFHLYKMLRFPNETQHFVPTCEIIAQHRHSFKLEEQKNLHAYLRNYCIFHINQGDKTFENELFSLFETHLAMSYLLNTANQLQPTNFKNIVVLALRLGHLAWTADFLEKYKPLLPENKQEETYQYCLARLFFEKKEYDFVCKVLINSDFEDIFFNIDARKLLLQSYYELQEWTLLDAAMNRFRVFLHRNKTISESHKLGNRNFVNILWKIVEHFPLNALVCKDLAQQIAETSPLAERNWLLAKIKND